MFTKFDNSEFSIAFENTGTDNSIVGVTLVDDVLNFTKNNDESINITLGISGETSLRVSSDNSLSTSIIGEASLRISSDKSLSTSIIGEASLRISSDKSLSTSIVNNSGGGGIVPVAQHIKNYTRETAVWTDGYLTVITPLIFIIEL